MVDCLRRGRLWPITAADGDDSLTVPAASLKGASMDNFSVRDSALMWLAAQSPAFAEEHTRLAPAVRKVRVKYQREILSLPGVKKGLEKLRASGIKPERVLMRLSALVQLDRDATWKNRTKEIQSALAKLARNLRHSAEEVEKTYRAGAIRPDLYALSLGISVEPARPYDPRKTIERMRKNRCGSRSKRRSIWT